MTPPIPPRRVTSHDVARRAGVSQATVSRALRGLKSISAPTRKHVARAAAELGYTPYQGTMLATRELTRQIAVVVDNLNDPFYPGLLEPIREYLNERGYRIVLVPGFTDDAPTAELISDGSYDGVLVTTAFLDSTLPFTMLQRGIPVAAWERINLTTIHSDVNRMAHRGARMMLQLLNGQNPKSETLPVHLVLRGTHDPAPTTPTKPAAPASEAPTTPAPHDQPRG